RLSVRRSLEFTRTFESYFLDEKLLDSSSFQKAMRFLSREDEEDDSTPSSQAGALDAIEEARSLLETLPVLDPAQYDLRRLHEALQHDVDALTTVWRLIEAITPEQDAKLQTVKVLLSGELKGRKVLL